MLITNPKADNAVGSKLSSFFPYHIPRDATYSASDMINMLNEGHRHAILAQSLDPLYSLGTISDTFSTPALALGLAAFCGFAALLYSAFTTIYGPFWLIMGGASAFFAAGGIYSLYDQLTIPTAPTTDTIDDGYVRTYLIADHYYATLSSPEGYAVKWSYYLKDGETTIPEDTFTANEVAYLFNTHDVYTVLNHQVDEDYAMQLTGSSWFDRVIMVD